MKVNTKFKVCCIASIAEAEQAIATGAWAIGLVGQMPSGPGPVSDPTIREIADATHDRVHRFLLTSRTGPVEVVEHVQFCGTDIVQLVDAVPVETYQLLRQSCPQVQIVQVVHVQDETALAQARHAAKYCDMVLLDSGQPDGLLRTLGGTGKTHNWDISKQIVEALDKPVLLAGGLSPENISMACAHVGPFAVDLCTGIRDKQYRLDPQRLAQFAAKL
ncbi:MAG: N-(5'-phosphoribosyl)anthranilate isomerase [Robiginitomaculum sp.]|nr:MAG: N-(5'-phosphoribosyl)anthranilate isomerase [Robiginitomaculum sp.]